jgi:membrane fusion protein, multidrug efflux system
MNSKRKFLAAAAVAAALVAGGGGSFIAVRGESGSAQAAKAPALPEVDVAKVVSKDIIEWQSFSGRLEAIDFVEIRALVPGTIVAVYFKDGAIVKKGDPLFMIDPRPYAAAVEQASAQLEAAKSQEVFASADFERAQKLVNSGTIPPRNFEQAQNAARSATANVALAEAVLDAAKVNLDYTKIVAPVSGRVSRAEMTLGNIVSTGSSAQVLTTVVSISPVYASFEVDEQTYLRYLSGDGHAPAPVSLGLANETGFSREGKIDSVDNRMNTASGTIRVRARFDNADHALLPGLYARIKMGGEKPRPAVMVDDAAVGTDQEKKFVMVVDDESRARYREVAVGGLYEGMRVIEKGLSPGDRIIVSGMQRAKPNDLVKINSIAMTGEPSAKNRS